MHWLIQALESLLPPPSLPLVFIEWVHWKGTPRYASASHWVRVIPLRDPRPLFFSSPMHWETFFWSLMEFLSGLPLPKFHLFQKHTNMLVNGHLAMTWATKVFPLKPSHKFEDISSSISNPKVLKFSPISCHDPTKCFHVYKSSQI